MWYGGTFFIWLPHLKEVSVVFLDLGFVIHPDFHPKAFFLAVTSHGIPVVSLIDLSMLQFPCLKKFRNDTREF